MKVPRDLHALCLTLGTCPVHVFLGGTLKENPAEPGTWEMEAGKRGQSKQG